MPVLRSHEPPRGSHVEYPLRVRSRAEKGEGNFTEASADLEREDLPPLETRFGDEHHVVVDAAKVSGIQGGSPDDDFPHARAMERLAAILGEHGLELELGAVEKRTLELLPPLPLYVAVNAGCNLKCWYCTEHGENRAFGPPTLPASQLLELLEVAHSRGFRTFRFTGGEPTLRKDLPELLRATQELGDDVRIAITTNGARLAGVLDTLGELEEPRVFLSVDGIAGADGPPAGGKRAFAVEKWLTPELIDLIDELRPAADVRLNYVLTRGSVGQIWDLINFAAGRGIDVKIFELLLRDFIGTDGLSKREAFDAQYVPIRSLVPELTDRYGVPERFPGLGGRGMPMRFVSTGNSRVIYFDGLGGSHYSGHECERCAHFPCQEGLYAPVLNASGTLHPAGCMNPRLYESVIDVDPDEAAGAFDRLKAEIQRSRLMSDIPEYLEPFVKSA
ncbi:MAG TPA: radical SAM protein [Solirubrobacterales bacterium]